MTKIVTYTGRQVDLCNPDPATIEILDIAHALAMQCRWNGHTVKFYSVAQHSVLVADFVPLEDRLAALLHDAAEAYLGDVVRPLKEMYGRTWTAIEDRIAQAIGQRYGVELVKLPETIREADDILLVTEARDVMRNGMRVLDARGHRTLCSPLPTEINPCGPDLAQDMFLHRFNEFGGKL